MLSLPLSDISMSSSPCLNYAKCGVTNPIFLQMKNDWEKVQTQLLFSERELTSTFAICYHPSVCLSVCRL